MNSYLLAVGAWLWERKAHLGWPLAVLFCGLWLRGCGALAECQDKLAAPVKVETAQGATQTAKASVRVQIVYRDREVPVGDAVTPSWKPLPCPDISVSADSTEEQTHWQSAQASTMPVFEPRKAKDGGVLLGVGYFGSIYGMAGIEHKGIKAFGQMGKDIYGGGVAYTVPLW